MARIVAAEELRARRPTLAPASTRGIAAEVPSLQQSADLSAGPYLGPVAPLGPAGLVPAAPVAAAGPELEGEGMLVAAFLHYIGVGQYANSMLRHGLDTFGSLRSAKERDLMAAGLPLSRVPLLLKSLERVERAQSGGGSEAPARPTVWLASEESRLAMAPPMRGSASGIWSEPSERARTLVQGSWDLVKGIGLAEVSTLLIRKLFQVAPSSTALFPRDVRLRYRDWSPEEGRYDESDVMNSPGLVKLFTRVLNALGGVVAGLHDIGQLVPQLLSLGHRHIDYGTEEEHWRIMQEVLVLVLRDGLGDAFTREVEHSWRMVYAFMSAVILDGLARAKSLRRSAQLEAAKLGSSGQWSVRSSTHLSSEQDTDNASLRSSSHSVHSASPFSPEHGF